MRHDENQGQRKYDEGSRWGEARKNIVPSTFTILLEEGRAPQGWWY